MEIDIAKLEFDFMGTSVICRSGSPLILADLKKVSVSKARAIIVLVSHESSDLSDARALRVVLSLTGVKEGVRGHVVVEMSDIDNEPLVKLVGGDLIETVVARDVIGRLMIQCALQPGLAQVRRGLFPKIADPPKYPECILFCGWRRDIDDMIMVLEACLAPGSQLWMFNEVPAKEREKKLADGGLDVSRLENIELVHHEGNAVIRRHLENLPLEKFDSILILADELLEDSVVQADSRSLATLLLIRDIQSERLQHKDRNSTSLRFSGFSHSSWIRQMQNASDKSIILSEILDSRTRNLVSVSRISDYVLSNELVSMALAMVAEDKQINRVLEELFAGKNSVNSNNENDNSGQSDSWFLFLFWRNKHDDGKPSKSFEPSFNSSKQKKEEFEPKAKDKKRQEGEKAAQQGKQASKKEICCSCNGPNSSKYKCTECCLKAKAHMLPPMPQEFSPLDKEKYLRYGMY
ncbi:probable ion channel POLLUX isoform X2 [Quercus robur]|uniref:probable ion channel POLLUX isoform X2 n=1 Tax=Quercus robur TaxID=38942 RepID=UPI0021634641|nr:probable ion channel POLLUX isoform X2 [Quercus robur]